MQKTGEKAEEIHILIAELADALAEEIEARYRGIKDHPAVTWRYERDMELVLRARRYSGGLERLAE